MRMIMTIYPTNLEISEGILQLIGHEALLSTAMIGVLNSVCELRSEPRQEREMLENMYPLTFRSCTVPSQQYLSISALSYTHTHTHVLLYQSINQSNNQSINHSSRINQKQQQQQQQTSLSPQRPLFINSPSKLISSIHHIPSAIHPSIHPFFKRYSPTP